MKSNSAAIFILVPFAIVACGSPTTSSDGPAAENSSEVSTDPCHAATLGNGDYCAKSLNPSATSSNLYSCRNGVTTKRVACAFACDVMPNGQDDVCRTTDLCASAALGNGDYCAQSLDARASAPELHTCTGKKTSSKVLCANGCQKMPDGQNDVCKPAGGGGGGGGGGTPGAAMGTFDFTFYWLEVESEYSSSSGSTDVYDPSCRYLATVPSAFFNRVTVEGSGRLNDGNVINYAGGCDCANSPCFASLGTSAPWGVGSSGRSIAPFRSIAVDPNVIPLGTKLYLPELDGVAVPGSAPWGGFVHDGCVSADDTGGAINQAHIDFQGGTHSTAVTFANRLGGITSITVRGGGTKCR
ncbi:MAG: 3D domain-containing protein [Polyangiaceae bacterium]